MALSSKAQKMPSKIKPGMVKISHVIVAFDAASVVTGT